MRAGRCFRLIVRRGGLAPAFLASPDRVDHLEVAKRVFSGLKKGTFVELDMRSVDLMRMGFGAPRHEFVAKS